MAFEDGVTGIILEAIFNGLFKFPGAGIRWLFLRNKRSFNSVFNDKWVNSITSFVLLAVVIALFL